MTRCAIATLALLLASPLAAETVVTCGSAEPVVPTRVTFYATSVHGPAYPGSLLDPDLSAVTGLPWQQWKCSGSDVVPMTAQELQAIADAEAAAALLAAREGAKAKYDAEIMARALAAVLLDVENKLILAIMDLFNSHITVGAAAGHNRPAITEAQVRTAIINRTGQIFTEAELRNMLRNKADQLTP